MHGKDLVISGLRDFNLKHIFDCGQCFRWNETEDMTYTGVAMGKALKIRQEGECAILFETSEKDFYGIWKDYFDLDTDYGKIKKALSTDEIMKKATVYGEGIRILNQSLWETVISFIISSSNNIPRIKGIIERLCAMYGEEIEYMGDVYYSFPSVKILSSLTREDLSPIRAGYRDKYILDAAKRFSDGVFDRNKIHTLSLSEAKRELLQIKGVGEKVANCILLFGLHRVEAFPVDVWIKRIMEYCYFDAEQTIPAISRFAEDKFHNLGGYAQQYLFFYAREEKIGTKGAMDC